MIHALCLCFDIPTKIDGSVFLGSEDQECELYRTWKPEINLIRESRSPDELVKAQ